MKFNNAKRMRFAKLAAAAVGLLCLAPAFLPASGSGALFGDDPEPKEPLDVPYEPTHPRVVEAMLELAHVTKDDVLYDLGCGDGRIAVLAALKYGARAVCIDLSAQRIREARELAQHRGVEHLITFITGDIFQADLRPATIVSMYLTTRVNRWLRVKLFSQLRPGTRLVSHAFVMSEWKPDRFVAHRHARNRSIFFWVMPADARGRWRWDAKLPGEDRRGALADVVQEFQVISGVVISARKKTPMTNASLVGRLVRFRAPERFRDSTVHVDYVGTIQGDLIEGRQRWSFADGRLIGDFPWTARRLKAE